MDFVGGIGGKMNRVCCGAVDLSGIIHGEAVFKMNTNHILWMVLDQSTKSVGFVTENIMRSQRRVKMVLKNIIVVKR